MNKLLKENELLPNGTDRTSAITAWKAISNSLHNIKQMMNIVYSNKKGNIGATDVQKLLDYINQTIDNCLFSTLPELKE